MDNLSSHKVAGVKEAIAATGATLLYLSPYSTDLNPSKSFSPKAAVRTTDALWEEIGQVLTSLSPTECDNYFASSGYVNI